MRPGKLDSVVQHTHLDLDLLHGCEVMPCSRAPPPPFVAVLPAPPCGGGPNTPVWWARATAGPGWRQERPPVTTPARKISNPRTEPSPILSKRVAYLWGWRARVASIREHVAVLLPAANAAAGVEYAVVERCATEAAYNSRSRSTHRGFISRANAARIFAQPYNSINPNSFCHLSRPWL